MFADRRRLYGVIAAAVALVIIVVAVIVAITGFNSPNRSALARTTVQNYWNDLHHGNTKSAYKLLTSGNRAARPFPAYSQDMFSFLTQTGGVTAHVYNSDVHGDQAVVRLDLDFVRANRPLHAWQHLFWENGAWRITDANGGVSQQK